MRIKTKTKLRYIILTLVISIFSSVIRVNYGLNVGCFIFLFGVFSFPVTIYLCYFIPKTNQFSDRIANYLLGIIVMGLILFPQFYIEEYFIDINLNKNGILIKAPIVEYNNGKVTEYIYSYKVNSVVYYQSLNVRSDEYNIGDTVLILASNKNPNIFKQLSVYKRK